MANKYSTAIAQYQKSVVKSKSSNGTWSLPIVDLSIGKPFARKGWGYYSSSLLFSVCAIIVFVLLFSNLYTAVNNGTFKTFGSLLEMLSNCPVVSMDWIIEFTTLKISLPDWLGWLSDLGDSLLLVVRLIAISVSGLWNAFIFISYFLMWVFL